MKINTAFAILAGFLIGLTARPQNNPVFDPIELGQTTETVSGYLQGRAGNITQFSPDAVVFPLAAHRESHWTAENFRTGSGVLSRVVFVFADDKLVFIQAEQGVMKQLETQPGLAFDAYADYRFYKDQNLVVHPVRDVAWKLNGDGLHLNLFAWDHPFLLGRSWPDYSRDVEVPDFLEMGGSLTDLEPLLKKASEFIYREELDGSDPNAQLQLNCFGVEYGGFSRKAEARFGDGQLNTVWILTAKAEEDRLRKSLTKTYGPPVFVSDQWEAYHHWQVFLRKDKPEILFLTEDLGQYYKVEYFGQ